MCERQNFISEITESHAVSIKNLVPNHFNLSAAFANVNFVKFD